MALVLRNADFPFPILSGRRQGNRPFADNPCWGFGHRRAPRGSRRAGQLTAASCQGLTVAAAELLGCPVEQLVHRPGVDDLLGVDAALDRPLAAVALPVELAGRVGVGVDGELAAGL